MVFLCFIDSFKSELLHINYQNQNKMNATKFLFVFLVTSLLGFTACQPTETAVDPKIGTWKGTTTATVGGSTVTSNVTVIYAADNTVTLTVMDATNTVTLATSASKFNKNVTTNVDVYETTSATTLGQPSTITDPYFKLRTVINGSTASVDVYTSATTVSAAEAVTTIGQSLTLTKQ